MANHGHYPPFTILEDKILDDARISKHGLLVYWVLSRHADQQGHCFPSIRRIAKQSRLGTATVWRGVEELISNGYIERRKRQVPGKKGKDRNLYTIITCSREEQGVPGRNRGVPGGIQGCSKGMKELDSLTRLTKLENSSLSAAPQKRMYHLIMTTLESANGEPFSNYSKEGQASKLLIKKSRTVCRGDAEATQDLLKKLIMMFIHLCQNEKTKYWTEVPLTPAQLNQRFDQVLAALRRREKDAAQAEAAREFSEAVS